MLNRLLIANRGEVAIRVAHAAREMGIVPLGIFSEADAGAYHLSFMDDARCVGAAPAAESYLNPEAILAAAREMRADSLHPGYGFLSERATFAACVQDAGLIFVGPPPAAMAASGSKIEAKRRATQAHVPTVPGYDGADQSASRLREEAERIGFPVLIKASAGGGGRGMRVVEEHRDFDEALAAAKRESLGAFGDDTVLLERYLVDPRHVEFQILADAHGTTLHLGERECSIQRRHQKLVEEAPSPVMTPELRAEMGDAAVRVARGVGYVNAGTAEFMLDPSGYYFLEMNARLQVEHPVTETVYGIDLVQWQLRIASGERLPFTQEELRPRGWAIEMRITAEDPAAMLPSAGRIERWEMPEGPGVRVDAGVTSGSDVGLSYDSMLAKLIVHASDRAAAVARMRRALGDFHVEGVRTNLPLLAWIARDDAFGAGEIDTSFLARRLDESVFVPVPPPRDALLRAVAAMLLADATPWRIGGVGRPISLAFEGGTASLWASATAAPNEWRLDGDVVGTLAAVRRGRHLEVRFNGQPVVDDGRAYAFRASDPLDEDAGIAATGAAPNGSIAAPMPGRVVRVAVRAGEEVVPHQLLVVLEAMKMEHRIEASLASTVRAVLVSEGEIVAGGTPLVELAGLG
ncbi:MAG TPA: biotin carboxylase N-terminal domain-containing protein [Candidatus Tyrphobacter sp.]